MGDDPRWRLRSRGKGQASFRPSRPLQVTCTAILTLLRCDPIQPSEGALISTYKSDNAARSLLPRMTARTLGARAAGRSRACRQTKNKFRVAQRKIKAPWLFRTPRRGGRAGLSLRRTRVAGDRAQGRPPIRGDATCFGRRAARLILISVGRERSGVTNTLAAPTSRSRTA